MEFDDVTMINDLDSMDYVLTIRLPFLLFSQLLSISFDFNHNFLAQL